MGNAENTPAENTTKHETPEAPTMPVWPNGFSALPNALVRSAVFTAGNFNQERGQFKRTFSVLGPGEVRYRGEELRQDDKHLLMVLTDKMRAAHGKKHLLWRETFQIDTTINALVTAMGWTRNKKSTLRLREAMSRLNATELLVLKNPAANIEDQEGRGFSIVQDYDFSPRKLTVRMPHAYFKVLAQGFTLVNLDTYKSLPYGFTRWLYTYVLTHEKQRNVSLNALISHSGLTVPKTANDRGKRRQTIRTAIAHLKAAGVLYEGGLWSGDTFTYTRADGARSKPQAIKDTAPEPVKSDASNDEPEPASNDTPEPAPTAEAPAPVPETPGDARAQLAAMRQAIRQ